MHNLRVFQAIDFFFWFKRLCINLIYWIFRFSCNFSNIHFLCHSWIVLIAIESIILPGHSKFEEKNWTCTKWLTCFILVLLDFCFSMDNSIFVSWDLFFIFLLGGSSEEIIIIGKKYWWMILSILLINIRVDMLLIKVIMIVDLFPSFIF